MIKNAIIYRISPDWRADLSAAEKAIAKASFIECGATQRLSIGFVPPRGDHGALIETVGGEWILKVRTDTRKVPADTLKKRVDELAAKVEDETGCTPGKKQRAELKEAAELELMPQAFVKTSTTLIWIDRASRTLVIDAASASRSEDAVTALVKALDGFAVGLIQTQAAPCSAMTTWLGTGEPLASFTVDRECELRSMDEMKSIIKYSRLTLDTDEVKAHIVSGKVATRLAMTWEGRVSFVLTDTLTIKKMAFLDVVFEGHKPGKDEAFDADVAIMTGELSKLLPDLIDAVGGELVVEVA